MKKRKQAYFDKYFERNWNITENIQKGIKTLISLKTVGSSAIIIIANINNKNNQRHILS